MAYQQDNPHSRLNHENESSRGRSNGRGFPKHRGYSSRGSSGNRGNGGFRGRAGGYSNQQQDNGYNNVRTGPDAGENVNYGNSTNTADWDTQRDLSSHPHVGFPNPNAQRFVPSRDYQNASSNSNFATRDSNNYSRYNSRPQSNSFHSSRYQDTGSNNQYLENPNFVQEYSGSQYTNEQSGSFSDRDNHRQFSSRRHQGPSTFKPKGINFHKDSSNFVRNKQPDSRARNDYKTQEPFEHYGERFNDSSSSSATYNEPKPSKSEMKPNLPKDANRREALSLALTRNSYDCMVCVEKVRRNNPIWSCQMCYNVFHLNCVKKWANSSADDVGWRCPGCQTYSSSLPDAYRCFCTKTKNPNSNRQDVPHSCGQTCGRKGQGGPDCTHPCQLLCHPGPCPPCDIQQTRLCCCGKKSATVKCSSKSIITCGSPCEKLLNCLLHTCKQLCHAGSCEDCDKMIQLVCHCRVETKKEPCCIETRECSNYSCGQKCGKKLNCTRHQCVDLCHPGICQPCKTSPEAILCCPCGQTSIKEASMRNKVPLRKSCLDPIPTCGKICRKALECGPSEKHHTCQELCHVNPECKPCPLVTPVKCRCNSQQFEIPCAEFRAYDDVICEKKCTKKRSCGRHKCNTKCCIDMDHVCLIVCNKQLRCNNHQCLMLCHNGHCPPCSTVSFEELTCECGCAVIYPPVPCGTSPPPCDQPCSRQHACDHPVHHPCHSEPNCPPCTILTEKWCYGKHEMRKSILCYIQQFSCGMPCLNVLSCGRHKCMKICHNGSCMAQNSICRLPCQVYRRSCGHYCASPCHNGPCPETKCKDMTEVLCPCGRRKEPLVCWKRQGEYDKIIEMAVAQEIKELSFNCENGEEINVDNVTASVKAKKPKEIILNCDKECARIERNKKLALALQLENPDVSSSIGTPHYSEMLLKFAKKNPQFVEMVHGKLKDLVMTAKKSKKMNNCYAFDSMNREKRHLIHEYSDHFGVLSESFDEEPNRNVVITASKEKSYLPAVGLIDAVFRPKAEAERKNAYEDVQLVAPMRSCIIAPQNKKLVLPPSFSENAGMVQLTSLSTPDSDPSTPSSNSDR